MYNYNIYKNHINHKNYVTIGKNFKNPFRHFLKELSSCNRLEMTSI